MHVCLCIVVVVCVCVCVCMLCVCVHCGLKIEATDGIWSIPQPIMTPVLSVAMGDPINVVCISIILNLTKN